ncbi:MAG: hypothetical protein KDJ40_04210, partial [Hyphomicrobiales bacterium]|nr:hypothetical protein [Hyphomicrobiales bacterium]
KFNVYNTRKDIY